MEVVILKKINSKKIYKTKCEINQNQNFVIDDETDIKAVVKNIYKNSVTVMLTFFGFEKQDIIIEKHKKNKIEINNNECKTEYFLKLK